jgi:hypothetical protein
MRTTVDIPDELYREAKARAALDGIRFRDLIEAGLRAVLASRQSGADEPRRASFPLIPKRSGHRITIEDVRRAEAETAQAEDESHGRPL